MMDDITLKELLAKYREGTCTAEEKTLLENWVTKVTYTEYEISEKDLIADLAAIRQNLPVTGKVSRIWPRIAAAASILLVLGAGGYFLLHKQSLQQVAQNDPEQLAPIQNGVTLTLAKGRQIRLDKKHNGQIAMVNGAQIRQQDSTLRYTKTTTSIEPATNTLTNNGSTRFSVALSDGTNAILDIGSSLTYPVTFNGKNRIVSMTGQVYFKVKHNATQHFLVQYAGQFAEDIGTEFNIDAYNDGTAAKTTLVEGAVKVSLNGSKSEAIMLKPGEQAKLNDNMLEAVPVKLEDVTAWLQGKLVFHNESLESILRRVARIYGVAIIYQDPELRKLTYYGSINSTKKLATVLNFFRKAGQVDFMVEGKTVKVFKQKANK